MGRTLLIGHQGVSWRDWIRENAAQRDLICLDPADPVQSPPGRLSLIRGGKVVRYRFYGGLDPARSPHVLVAALADLLEAAQDDAVIQAFAYRPTPLLRQTLHLLAQLAAPTEILVADQTPLDQSGFPVGPETIALPPAFPSDVQAAQRKAHWLKLFESCAEHSLDLRAVSLEGTRLGTGRPIPRNTLDELGLGSAALAEVGAASLTIVADDEPQEAVMAKALDFAHASRAHVVAPAMFENLMCSFARADGEDFGIGVVQCVDFAAGAARILNTAVAPAPVRILRLGSLRVDGAGRELGELRPWQV